MSSEEEKNRASIKYYKNREYYLAYQREYDKTHKEIKSIYDKKRRTLKNYNKIKMIQHYSKRNHFNKLLKIYGGCLICGSKENLEIHHKNYTKKFEDCLLLCQPCHKKIHRKKPYNSFLEKESPKKELLGER